jgi:hypothetical protein
MRRYRETVGRAQHDASLAPRQGTGNAGDRCRHRAGLSLGLGPSGSGKSRRHRARCAGRYHSPAHGGASRSCVAATDCEPHRWRCCFGPVLRTAHRAPTTGLADGQPTCRLQQALEALRALPDERATAKPRRSRPYLARHTSTANVYPTPRMVLIRHGRSGSGSIFLRSRAMRLSMERSRGDQSWPLSRSIISSRDSTR